MNLREYSWKGYYSGDRDHAASVLVPALHRSIRYDRITGDYSSSVLSALAPGIERFVENNGEIRLIAGVPLNRKDIEMIEYGEAEKVLMDRVDWKTVEEVGGGEALKALSWLVANEFLNIKFGATTDSAGRAQPEEYGKWHQKEALFYDSEGNGISIIGSLNESYKALGKNRESLSLVRNWIDEDDHDWTEKQRFQAQQREFDNAWNDNLRQDVVFDLPEGKRRELITKWDPSEEPNWNEIYQEDHSASKKLPSPYIYQRRAIDRFLSNNNRIILNHATGTGKTWTSLFIIDEQVDTGDVILVLTPQRDLVNQWVGSKNIPKFFPEGRIIPCHGETEWNQDLYTALVAETEVPIFVVSTMNSKTLDRVCSLIGRHTDSSALLLVVDEVHRLGSEKRREIVSEISPELGRIGLSATPERGDEGDKFLRSFISAEEDDLSLQEAIYDYKVLSRYNYHVSTVSLSAQERDEFRKWARKIAGHIGSHSYQSISLIENPELSSLVQKKRNIVKTALEKDQQLLDQVEGSGEKILIFCGDKSHARRIYNKLKKTKLKTRLYLGEHSPKHRDSALNDLETGRVDVVVSIDCLTEGVDVPSCDVAFLVANSTSDREAIQRRGRVLRKASKKDVARIYDYVVLPTGRDEFISGNAELAESEVSMVEEELRRAKLMNQDSENKMENRPDLITLNRHLRQYT